MLMQDAQLLVFPALRTATEDSTITAYPRQSQLTIHNFLEFSVIANTMESQPWELLGFSAIRTCWPFKILVPVDRNS